MRFSLPLGLALATALATSAIAAESGPGHALPPKDVSFSFEGPFGTYDRGALQRGFQVYKEVCSACHSLNRVAFHALADEGGPGFTEAQAKAIAAGYKVPAGPNDKGETTDANGTPLTSTAPVISIRKNFLLGGEVQRLRRYLGCCVRGRGTHDR